MRHSIATQIAREAAAASRTKPRPLLKPCPFCGGSAKRHAQRASEDSEVAWVECEKCEARTCMFEDAYAPHDQAIDYWNRREPAPGKS